MRIYSWNVSWCQCTIVRSMLVYTYPSFSKITSVETASIPSSSSFRLQFCLKVNGIFGTMVGEFMRGAVVVSVTSVRVQTPLSAKQHFVASWNSFWNQSTVVHSVPVFQLLRKCHQIYDNLCQLDIPSFSQGPIVQVASTHILRHSDMFVRGSMAFSVWWSGSLGARRLMSLCPSTRVQLHQEPNSIYIVMICPDARAQRAGVSLPKKIPSMY